MWRVGVFAAACRRGMLRSQPTCHRPGASRRARALGAQCTRRARRAVVCTWRNPRAACTRRNRPAPLGGEARTAICGVWRLGVDIARPSAS
eukprot:670215-Prymnesium_polylepis.1